MRDILRELYCACSLLRRRGVPRKGAPDAPLCIRMAGEQALAANSSQSRIVVVARCRRSFASSTRNSTPRFRPSVAG
jgi:hypothetical protein